MEDITEGEPEVKVSGRLSLQDLELAYATERGMVAVVRGGKGAAFLGPVLLAWMLWSHSRGEGVHLFLVLALLFSVAGSFAPSLPRVLAKREIEATGAILRTYAIGPRGVSVQQAQGIYLLPWTSIAGYQQGADWFWIYPPKGVGIFLPKRLLEPHEQAALVDRLASIPTVSARDEFSHRGMHLVLAVIAVGALLAHFAINGTAR